MATFVLIPGAWHGGWCFDTLRPLLEAEGHNVLTPNLPGMGGDAATLGAVTLAGWADFTADLCRNAQAPVILCGHSRGGIVISEAAERAPEHVAALVYICAMLIPSGLSRVDMRASGQANPDFDAIRTKVPNGTVIDASRAAAIFAQRLPPDRAADAMARLVAEPDAPSATRLQLTNANYGSVPRHYIECTADRAIFIADQRRMQALQPCATITTLDADHSPYLSAPRALADGLISIAKGTTQ
jgi:pimeloyl-ACP methyl ester carboxylesterase